MNFRIGQKVVCVDDANFAVDKDPLGKRALPNRPIKGCVYTVRGFVDHDAIYLEEIRNPKNVKWGDGIGEGAFYAKRFRPIVERKTDISFAVEILRKATRKRSVDA